MSRRLRDRFGWSVSEVLAVLVAVSAATWCSFALHNFLVDDAFISFRYAENLALGKGLAYNAGERVEGYTNFLWIMILALVRYLGGDIPGSARYLGFAFGVGGLFASLLLGTRVFTGKWQPLRWLPFLLVATNRSYWLWAVSGMETTLFAFLITLGMALAFGAPSARNTVASATVWFLATLVRPEGSMLFLLACMWRQFQRGSSPLATGIPREALLYVGMLLPYLAWKWLYFGALLPNTFHAKNVGRLHLLPEGLDYARAFFADYGFGAGLAGALAGLVKAPEGISLPKVRLLSLALLAYSLVILAAGGDIYYFSRFFAPLLPLLYIVLAAGGLALAGALTKGSARRAMALAACLTLLIHSAGTALQEKRHRHTWSTDGENTRLRTRAGMWLKENYASSTVIATIAAGCLPYYSKLRNIDLAGLTNKEIGTKEVSTPGALAHEKFSSEYVLAQEPQMIQFYIREEPVPLPWEPGMRLSFARDFAGCYGELGVSYPSEADLLLTAAFHERYQFRTFVIDPLTAVSSFVRLPAGSISRQAALGNLGCSHLEMGHPEQGMSLLVQALRQDPRDAAIRKALGAAFVNFGADFDRALWKSEIDKVYGEQGPATTIDDQSRR